MKIPAIRSKIGIWVYYISTLSFEQVSRYVKKVDDELHKSILLRDMLQRSITDNYKNISNYITQQEERFFNALVLAVYDGDPQWHEVLLEYDDGDEFSDLGILELNGNEKIFPIDGQHRVEGIKKAIVDNPDLCTEKIPVIFIGHKKDNDGMQRARRMFSTLNRYAKPVSLRDIIALDEDDVIAIACRELIDNHPFFSDGKILDSKNKAISERNKEFTTIITFYECNRELLQLYIENKDIFSVEGRKLRGTAKLNEYIRYRPTDDDIEKFLCFAKKFWTTMEDSFVELKEYSNNKEIDSHPYRNKNGGSLFFRPTALLAIIKATIHIKKLKNIDFEQVFFLISRLPLTLDSSLWRNVLWNKTKQVMLTTNSKTVELLIIYCVDRELLKESEKQKLIKDLQSLLLLDDEASVIEHLEDFLL